MDKDFVYNPEPPCIVLRNGEDVGALVAGRLYRFDCGLKGCPDTCILVDDLLFEFGERVGHLEGNKIVIEASQETLELIES